MLEYRNEEGSEREKGQNIKVEVEDSKRNGMPFKLKGKRAVKIGGK